MTSQNTQPEEQITVEDLTVNETETANIKGGSGRYLIELQDLKGDVDPHR